MWHSPFSSWIRGTLGQSSHRGRQSRRNRRRRLFVESLEDRALLSAKLLTVSTTAPAGPGSLAAEVAEAKSGDAIIFLPSLANKTILLFGNTITIDKQLFIDGEGVNGLRIDGGDFNGNEIFNIGPNGNATISGLTLTDGKGLEGGAIHNAGHRTLNDDLIESNSSFSGGAVYNAGTLTINKSALEGNTTSASGGAIDNAGAGTLTLTDSSVINNRAADGGGGVANDPNGHVTISNCTFTEDNADFGGALYDARFGTMTISESTIASNSAASKGGGLFLDGNVAVVHMTNTIIANNQAGEFGGPDVDGAVASQGFNLVGNTNHSSGWVQGDLTGTATKPLKSLLGPLSTQGIQSYFPLQPGSPALTNGNPTSAPATDQLGHQRVVNGKIDIGAIENQSTAAAATTSVPLSQQGTPAESALSTVFSADSELWALLSSGMN